jgi:uncharacterized RDD family membrane protein YckC
MTATPPPTVSWAGPEPNVGPAPGIEFAPHGGRLVAYLIDSVIISVIALVTIVIALPVMLDGATIVDDKVTGLGSGAALGFLIALIGFAICLLYFPLFWARGGQTPGMRPFALRVVRDRDGGRIGWGTALLRLVGLWVAAAVFYIGFIWVFIDKRHRGWQDLIAGTVVVKQG